MSDIDLDDMEMHEMNRPFMQCPMMQCPMMQYPMTGFPMMHHNYYGKWDIDDYMRMMTAITVVTIRNNVMTKKAATAGIHIHITKE